MAQDHRVVVSEVAHQPVALVEIERYAFVVVGSWCGPKNCIDIWFKGQQALLLRRHRQCRPWYGCA